jgi:AraC-like DNA-binding protein
MEKIFINVSRILKQKYLPPFTTKWSYHDFYHFIYITIGTGCILINDKKYIAKKGELYPVKRHELHLTKTYKDNIFHTIEIKFSTNNRKIINDIDGFPDRIMTPDYVYSILNTIAVETINKNKYYKDLINSKFTELLFYMIRLNIEEKDKIKITSFDEIKYQHHEESERFFKVKEYIKNNLSSNIDTKELALIAGLSKTYFIRVFKENYGVAPITLINNIKFIEAKKMLEKYPQFNVSQIAESLGFKSVHYFSRFFKKYEGLSPMNYLTKRKINIKADI